MQERKKEKSESVFRVSHEYIWRRCKGGEGASASASASEGLVFIRLSPLETALRGSPSTLFQSWLFHRHSLSLEDEVLKQLLLEAWPPPSPEIDREEHDPSFPLKIVGCKKSDPTNNMEQFRVQPRSETGEKRGDSALFSWAAKQAFFPKEEEHIFSISPIPRSFFPSRLLLLVYVYSPVR